MLGVVIELFPYKKSDWAQRGCCLISVANKRTAITILSTGSFEI